MITGWSSSVVECFQFIPPHRSPRQSHAHPHAAAAPLDDRIQFPGLSDCNAG